MFTYLKHNNNTPSSSPNQVGNGHKLFIAGGIILAVLLVFSAVSLASLRTSWRGKASETSEGTVISRENSYVFASPLTATADGTSPIRITVFLLNNQGLGVSGQEVTIKAGALTVEKTQSITDSIGRAIFEVTTTTAGSYTISAEAAGSTLPQSVSISFQ